MIEMIPVFSKTILSVGYSDFSQTLRIRFQSGMFDYYEVPKEVYLGFINAYSHEDYFVDFIRDVYRSKQIA